MWKIDDAELGGAATSGTLDQEGYSADSDLPVYPIIYVVVVSNSSISCRHRLVSKLRDSNHCPSF